jgi:hypothetical protein
MLRLQASTNLGMKSCAKASVDEVKRLSNNNTCIHAYTHKIKITSACTVNHRYHIETNIKQTTWLSNEPCHKQHYNLQR